MPVATSSRRRPAARRQNSEDIEDTRSTQVNGHDDDVSDEERPRKVKSEKKAKGKQKAAPPVDEDDDGDAGAAEDVDDEDDEDRIDVTNFPNQPLRKQDITKLRGISGDWTDMRTKIGQKSDIYKDVAAALVEAGEDDIASSKYLQALEEDMREFIDVTAEMASHSKALDAIATAIAQGDQVDDAHERYEKGLKIGLEEYAGKTKRQKYAKDERYRDFHSSIWDVKHPDDPMPPVTEFMPREDGDDSDDDDDLEIGGVTQDYKCPISLTPLVNPVTSRVCKHSFSADSLKEYCPIASKFYKCPAAGCNKSFRLSDCASDDALAKKVKQYQRRVAANEQESDAEEVVSD